jgi:hypothetical protein
VLDPLTSMEHLEGVRGEVAGVVFNAGSDASFRAPTEALFEYARGFGVPLSG